MKGGIVTKERVQEIILALNALPPGPWGISHRGGDEFPEHTINLCLRFDRETADEVTLVGDSAKRIARFASDARVWLPELVATVEKLVNLPQLIAEMERLTVLMDKMDIDGITKKLEDMDKAGYIPGQRN